MALYTITTVDDVVDENDGVLSLREAVALANADGGADTIVFSAETAGKTITLSSELAISSDMTIDGDTDGDRKADIAISGNDLCRVASISGTDTDVALKSLTLANGHSDDQGGAVLAWQIGKLSIEDTTIENSTSGSYGGGLRAYGAEVVIANSLISNNVSAREGGGLFMTDSDATIVNSTFYGNAATEGGGGIGTWTSNLDIYQSTITNNYSDDASGGGGLSEMGSSVNVVNTVIAWNLARYTSTPVDVFGTLLSSNNSAFSSAVTITSGLNNLLDVANLGMAALADNGGPVQTVELVGGSVLIDAGNNSLLPGDTLDLDGDLSTNDPLRYDARGFDRVANGTVDIGAFEYRQGVDLSLYSALLDLSFANASGAEVPGSSLFDGANETVVFALSKTVYGTDTISLETRATIEQANALKAAARAAGHDLDIRIVCLDGYDGPLAGLAGGIDLLHVTDPGSNATKAALANVLTAYSAVGGQHESTIGYYALHRLPASDAVNVVASTQRSDFYLGAGYFAQTVLAEPLEEALAATGPAIDLTEFKTPSTSGFSPVGVFDEIGEIVPDFEFTDASGEAFSLRGEARGLMVITTCAEWCAPCRLAAAELPSVVSRFGKDFTFVELMLQDSLSRAATTETAARWSARYDFTTPVVSANGDAQTAIDFERGANLRAFPTYLIIDRMTGAIVSRFVGTGTDDFTEALADVSDDYYGSLARKTFTGTLRNDSFKGGLGFDTIAGGEGGDTLRGANGNDRISGDAGDDRLFGDSGRDTLSGGVGADHLYGGAGSDTVAGGRGADVLSGGLEQDTVTYSASKGAVNIDLATGATKGADARGDILSSIENIVGTAFADVLKGNDENNVIEGGGGRDTLSGGLGINTLSYATSQAGVKIDLSTGLASGGDAAGDQFSGFANVTGSKSADIITGDAGTNQLFGGAGNDIIVGGGGMGDIIAGGKGVDRLTGGSGQDYFYLRPAFADRDVIVDFSNDMLCIDPRLFGAGFDDTDKLAVRGGHFDITLFVANATGQAENAEDRLIYNTSSGELFLDTNGTEAGGSRRIATLVGSPALTAYNFDLLY